MNVGERELKQLRDASVLLGEISSAEELPRRTFEIVGGMVPSDISSYELVTEDPDKSTYVTAPAFIEVDHEAYMASLGDHPLIQHARQMPGLGTTRMADVIDRRGLRRLNIYNYVLRPLGIEEQMALSSPAGPGAVFGLTLNRLRGPFSDRERLLLELLGPSILASRRHARLRSLAVAAIEAEERHAERTRLGIVLVDRRGAPRRMTSRAEELLARVEQLPTGAKPRLPERIAAWVRIQVRDAPIAGGGRRVTRVRCDGGFVRAEFVPASSSRHSHALLLWQERHAAATLAGDPLTPRQHEVFAHLARGMTDKEIAKALDLSIRTVQKHLERGYRTLGVGSRGEAIVRLLGDRLHRREATACSAFGDEMQAVALE
jgi:DNA-binding CsgD family transcriptional regulator